jgi:hypothetical protein
MLVVPQIATVLDSWVNGAIRTRTGDPLNAIEVRYQLRYSPLMRIQ